MHVFLSKDILIVRIIVTFVHFDDLLFIAIDKSTLLKRKQPYFKHLVSLIIPCFLYHSFTCFEIFSCILSDNILSNHSLFIFFPVYYNWMLTYLLGIAAFQFSTKKVGWFGLLHLFNKALQYTFAYFERDCSFPIMIPACHLVIYLCFIMFL